MHTRAANLCVYSVGVYALSLLWQYFLSWVGLRHGLHCVEKRKISFHFENPTTIPSMRSRSPIHYTDCARKRQ